MKQYQKYEVTVETLEPFRIGSVRDIMDVADNPIATVGGRPVIQGPSLKGAFRAAVEEYLVAEYGNDERIPARRDEAVGGTTDKHRPLQQHQ